VRKVIREESVEEVIVEEEDVEEGDLSQLLRVQEKESKK
jgi:hypothetical protein